MLISKKQLQANQANAKKSTGPKTPQGKDITRLNAMKNMLYTKETVVYSAGETDEMWINHWQTIVDDLRPQDSIQFLLVHDIASCTFRLLRIKRMEAGHLDARCAAAYNATMTRDTDGTPINVLYDGFPNGQNEANARLLGDTAVQVTTCTKLLPDIWRQEVRLRNAWKQNLKLLKELQAEAALQDSDQPSEPEPEPAPQSEPAAEAPQQNEAQSTANKAQLHPQPPANPQPAPKPVTPATSLNPSPVAPPNERRG